MTFVSDKFFALLRFLNLLEPRSKILSISKAFMWVTVFTTAYVTIMAPDQVAAVLTAAGAQLVATANYAYRRFVQVKIGEAQHQSDETR